jgi:hypothetical protein
MDERELERLRSTLAEYGEVLRDTLTPSLERSTQLGEQVFGMLRSGYRTAGAVYGDTDDGLMRWLTELGQIARCEARIEEIRQHHEMLATLRRHLDQLRQPT